MHNVHFGFLCIMYIHNYILVHGIGASLEGLLDPLIKEEEECHVEERQFDQVETKTARHNLKPINSGDGKPHQCPPPVPKVSLNNIMMCINL